VVRFKAFLASQLDVEGFSFNSKVVRFKAILTDQKDMANRMFQFQSGAIQSKRIFNDFNVF